MSGRFENKVVVITGAAGGIGSAAAVRFAQEGARLVLVDLAETALDDVAAAVTQAGGTAVSVAANVTCSDDVARYVAAALEQFGGIDCFFNNAGVEGVVTPLLDYPEADFDRVLAVNVKGVWLGLQHVGRAMRERGGGAIVNTASVAGLRGGRSQIAPYTTSKWAVIGLTRTAALEFAAHGIRVNAVCPAPVETRMMRARAWAGPGRPRGRARANGRGNSIGALCGTIRCRGAGGVSMQPRRRVHNWRYLPG